MIGRLIYSTKPLKPRKRKQKSRAKRRPQLECFGCKAMFTPARAKAQPICQSCRAVPEVRWKLKWVLEQERNRRVIDGQAERETEELNKKPVYNPLIGERLVLMMQRGEW